MQQLQQFYIWLASIGVAVPTLVLSVSVFLAVLLMRKAFPTLWLKLVGWVPSLGFDETPGLEALHKFVQALPALVLSAVVSAASTGGNFKAALWLAIAGPLSVAIHEFLKAVPAIPYVGALGQRKVPPMPALMLCFMLCVPVVLFCSACGWLKGSALPVAEECAPTAEGLLADVAEVLLSGDYEKELAREALMEGQATVDCAVQEYLARLKSGKVSASPERMMAREHAEAYLAKRRVK